MSEAEQPTETPVDGAEVLENRQEDQGDSGDEEALGPSDGDSASAKEPATVDDADADGAGLDDDFADARSEGTESLQRGDPETVSHGDTEAVADERAKEEEDAPGPADIESGPDDEQEAADESSTPTNDGADGGEALPDGPGPSVEEASLYVSDTREHEAEMDEENNDAVGHGDEGAVDATSDTGTNETNGTDKPKPVSQTESVSPTSDTEVPQPGTTQVVSGELSPLSERSAPSEDGVSGKLKKKKTRRKVKTVLPQPTPLLKMMPLDESETPQPRGAPSKPAIFAEVYGGGSYGLDLFTFTHNAVRRELSDLYDLLWALDRFGADVTFSDIDKFYAWWGVFSAFCRDCFDIEERFVYPLITVAVPVQGLASNTDRMRQKAELIRAIVDVDRCRARHATATAQMFLYRLFNLVDRFAPTLLAFFAHEEKNLPQLVEDNFTEQEKLKLDERIVTYMSKSRNRNHTFPLLLRWMNADQRGWWRKMYLPKRVDLQLPGWVAAFDENHLDIVNSLLERAKMPRDDIAKSFGPLSPRTGPGLSMGKSSGVISSSKKKWFSFRR